MSDQESVKDVKDLFDQAKSAGAMSQAAYDVVVANLNASAMALEACQGADPFALGGTEATIVAFVVDKSGSMHEVEAAVRDSVMESVVAMQESKGSEVFTLSLINFADRVEVVFANQPVDSIKSISYSTGGQTALYDAMLDALTGAAKYEEELLRIGYTTKVIIVVFSDAANNASKYATEAKVRTFAQDMGRRENWTLAFVGFKTYEADYGTDYDAIAAGAGFPAVITIDLGDDEYTRRHAIRQTFMMVSKSVIRRSQQVIDPNADPQDFFDTAI